MTSRVDRVHVRCTAPPEQGDRALRLRGRLVGTARTHLPEALAHSLDDGRSERRIFAERVCVELDFDPDDYDDVTTAVLWAGRVRAALQLEAAAAGGGVEIFESDAAFYGRAALEYARSGELPWFFAELPCGVGRPEPRAFLDAFDTPERVVALARALAERPDAAGSLYARLGETERRTAVEALEGTRSWGEWAVEASPSEAPAGARRVDAAEPAAYDEANADAAATAAAAGDAAAQRAARPRTSAARDDEQPATPATLARWRAALERVARGAATVTIGPARPAPPRDEPALPASRAPARPPAAAAAEPAQAATPAEAAPEPHGEEPASAEAAPEDALSTETAWWTRVGGLVLLYPWLADLLEPDVPVGDELAFRSWALAAVMRPEEEELVLADPLVRVLAGDDPSRRPPRLAPPADLDRVREAAGGVIRSFAGCLPGFEESSPEYLRRFVLERGALVAALPEGGFGVRLEPMPLDPVLLRLPYPLGPFRFAWTEQISVELRRA